MKAIVDRDACIGCELCVNVCPQVFVMDDEIKATVILDVIPQEFEACTNEAKDQCPVIAIAVE